MTKTEVGVFSEPRSLSTPTTAHKIRCLACMFSCSDEMLNGRATMSGNEINMNSIELCENGGSMDSEERGAGLLT